jgi:hypothetical protein
MLGIPLISLIGYWRGFEALKARERTPWDQAADTRVDDAGTSVARNVLAFTAIVAVMTCLWMVAKE